MPVAYEVVELPQSIYEDPDTPPLAPDEELTDTIKRIYRAVLFNTLQEATYRVAGASRMSRNTLARARLRPAVEKIEAQRAAEHFVRYQWFAFKHVCELAGVEPKAARAAILVQIDATAALRAEAECRPWAVSARPFPCEWNPKQERPAMQQDDDRCAFRAAVIGTVDGDEHWLCQRCACLSGAGHIHALTEEVLSA